MVRSGLTHRTASAPADSAGHIPTQRVADHPYRMSGALLVAAALAAGIGVFHPGVFHDPAVTAGNAQGTALVILMVAIPAVVAAMILAAQGSLRAQIVWLGALGYIVYNSVFFAYGMHFNPLFLLYAATLSLALWSVVTLLREVDVEGIRTHFTPGTPVRGLAGYLLVTTAMFALVWLKDVIPAIAGNTTPASLTGTGMVTNPIQVTDFAFGFPIAVLAAIWLWQCRAWGYLLGGAFLVYGVIEAVSVTMDRIFGHLSDQSQSLAAVPLFAALALIGLVPLVFYFRNLQEAPTKSHYVFRYGSSGEKSPRRFQSGNSQ
jgi:hypothetical protein